MKNTSLLSLKKLFRSSGGGEERELLALQYVSEVSDLISEKQQKGEEFYWKDLPWVIQFWPVISFFYEDRDLINFLNPCPEVGGMSGLIGYSKKDIHDTFPDRFLPETLNFLHCPTLQEVLKKMKEREMKFPVFCKPDVGERAAGVRRISSEKELQQYLSDFPQRKSLIVQHPAGSKWDECFEYGVQVVRDPKTDDLKITSAELKSLPFVVGNGKQSVEILVRALPSLTESQRKNILEDLSHTEKGFVPSHGKKVSVVHAASVSRGTKMVSLTSELAHSELEKSLKNVLQNLNHFSSGRFDLMAQSEEHLVRGEFEIIEGNAGAAIPLQVYRNDLEVCEVYELLFRHFFLLKENAQRNFEIFKNGDIPELCPMTTGQIVWQLTKSLLQQRSQWKSLAAGDTRKMFTHIRKSARPLRWKRLSTRTREKFSRVLEKIIDKKD